MLRLDSIVGHASDPDIAEKLHVLQHENSVERITLSESDTQRKRLRLTGDKGTDCAIILDRNESLHNGSVLLLEKDRAIVVELDVLPWLIIEPDSRETALELGFLAGHLHWRVRFDGTSLLLAIEQEEQNYLDRIEEHLDGSRIRFNGYA